MAKRTVRGIGAGTLALHLAGIGLAAGCSEPMEPEPHEAMDLGVPEFALIDGLELRAQLDVTQASPATRVQVSVSATNRTDRAIEFTAGTPCFVRPLVYAKGAGEWIRYPGSPEVLLGLFLCPQVVFFVTVPPGETLTLSSGPQFGLADWVGMEFRPGAYVVTATVSGSWGGGSHEVEILAGQVDSR
ncbi:MAG: hypothetical protein OXN85_03915 [Gemmatimonadetes bacterium]|nr:hypothetical protein [Candidatus Palauibacter australiensis]